MGWVGWWMDGCNMTRSSRTRNVTSHHILSHHIIEHESMRRWDFFLEPHLISSLLPLRINSCCIYFTLIFSSYLSLPNIWVKALFLLCLRLLFFILYFPLIHFRILKSACTSLFQYSFSCSFIAYSFISIHNIT